MTRPEPSNLFAGRNMMTPDIVEYGWINEQKTIAYELSEGHHTGPFSMAGVTLANIVGSNKSFSGKGRNDVLKQAREYINELKQGE